MFFLFQCLFEIKKKKTKNHTKAHTRGDQARPRGPACKADESWVLQRAGAFPIRGLVFWTSGGWRSEPVASGGGWVRGGGSRPRDSRAARLGVDAEEGSVDTGVGGRGVRAEVASWLGRR